MATKKLEWRDTSARLERAYRGGAALKWGARGVGMLHGVARRSAQIQQGHVTGGCYAATGKCVWTRRAEASGTGGDTSARRAGAEGRFLVGSCGG